MFIHFCLTNGFINSNKQKEIPHRAGSKWTLTERDWTGLDCLERTSRNESLSEMVHWRDWIEQD